MTDQDGHAESSRILLAGAHALLPPSAAISGLGAAMEAASIALSHRVDCVAACACGGADHGCPGCGRSVHMAHTPDCVAACAVCPVAEVVGELVTAYSARCTLAEPMITTPDDLALLLLCASFGVSMIGEVFCRIMDESMADTDFDWTPVMDHFGTLFEHAKVDDMIAAGRMLDGSRIKDCADV